MKRETKLFCDSNEEKPLSHSCLPFLIYDPYFPSDFLFLGNGYLKWPEPPAQQQVNGKWLLMVAALMEFLPGTSPNVMEQF